MFRLGAFHAVQAGNSGRIFSFRFPACGQEDPPLNNLKGFLDEILINPFDSPV
jgi:hypothetical protein